MDEEKIGDKDLYRVALDTRNLEITLFWQRCNYFLVLNSALALGFFNVRTFRYSLLLAAVGLITSMLWFGVSLGSKFWQSRWEYRLAEIEKQVAPTAKLFATDRPIVQKDVEESLRSSQHGWFQRQLDALVLRKPSVSLMMMILSLVFVAAWVLAIILLLWPSSLTAADTGGTRSGPAGSAFSTALGSQPSARNPSPTGNITSATPNSISGANTGSGAGTGAMGGTSATGGTIQIQIQTSSGGNTGGTIQIGPMNTGPTNRPDPSDFAALLISFVVWCLAFFLLHDAGRFQKWQSADDSHAPNPLAGTELAWIVSLSVLVLWGLYVMFLFRLRVPAFFYLTDDQRISLLLGESRLLVPGVLIAALFPAAVAVFKYVTATLAIRTPGGIPGPRSRGLAGALVALINLAASVATLVVFRDYLFRARP